MWNDRSLYQHVCMRSLATLCPDTRWVAGYKVRLPEQWLVLILLFYSFLAKDFFPLLVKFSILPLVRSRLFADGAERMASQKHRQMSLNNNIDDSNNNGNTLNGHIARLTREWP